MSDGASDIGIGTGRGKNGAARLKPAIPRPEVAGTLAKEEMILASWSSSEVRPSPVKFGKDRRSHGGTSISGAEGGKAREAGRGERYSAERSGRRRK